jgi:hypothetical protein
MLAAMEHIDMPFGIYGDTAALDEVFAGRQLKEIWNCLIIELRDNYFRLWLRKCGVARDKQRKNADN